MRYVLNFSHQHQPMEDHSFVDDGQLLTSKTLRGLVAAVRAYRETNGFPVGDPEQDIAQYYCQKYPWLVSPLKNPPESPLRAQELTGEAAAMEAVECFVRELWHNPPKRPCEARETVARIAVCRECPYQQPLDMTRNRECTRRAYLIAKGELAKDIGYCEHHRWLNGLAVLLPEPIKLARPGRPAGCWVRTDS
jgi:hypothetical protein